MIVDLCTSTASVFLYHVNYFASCCNYSNGFATVPLIWIRNFNNVIWWFSCAPSETYAVIFHWYSLYLLISTSIPCQCLSPFMLSCHTWPIPNAWLSSHINLLPLVYLQRIPVRARHHPFWDSLVLPRRVPLSRLASYGMITNTLQNNSSVSCEMLCSISVDISAAMC